VDVIRDGVEMVNVDELRHTEGNVILHIVFAIKQDQDRGREFLKYLKTCQLQANEHVLAPFNVALALSMARIQRFEEQILDLLKSAIMTNIKDSERYRRSKWIQEHVPPPLDVEENILQTVKNSKYGWDHVSQGIVRLGFLLMGSSSQRHDSESVATVWPSINQCAGRLGVKILLETFKCQDFVRSEILEQTLNRIVTRGTVPSSHYIELLNGAVASCPRFLIDSLTRVKETFDYLSFLPVSTARGLLQAIEPLLKVNLSLRDSLMLVLRKSLFSRQVEARKIAVMGYLLVLEKFKIVNTMLPSSQPLSQSLHLSQQVEVDVHCRPDAAANEVLCLEILGKIAHQQLIVYEDFRW
jgi:Fanconi anemia group I protein